MSPTESRSPPNGGEPLAATYDSEEKINSFLHDFIRKGSPVDIFTGTLSWVASNPEMKKLLMEKAKTQHLSIFMPKRNQVARELEESGVEIVYYSKLINEIPTRFTLVNRGKPGSQALAIGKGILPAFEISVYKDDEHPMVIGAISSMIALLEKLTKPDWREWLRLVAAFSGIVGFSFAVSVGRLGLETAFPLSVGVAVLVVLFLRAVARVQAPRGSLRRALRKLTG